MVKAIIMVKVDAGKDKEVLEKIKIVNGVEHACATYGIYDLVVRVHYQSVESLDKFVFHDLRTIPSVRETATLICSSFVT
jgi:DNA-binding Lrp family transcriptional regulator